MQLRVNHTYAYVYIYTALLSTGKPITTDPNERVNRSTTRPKSCIDFFAGWNGFPSHVGLISFIRLSALVEIGQTAKRSLVVLLCETNRV